jgi:hypothetical protein
MTIQFDICEGALVIDPGVAGRQAGEPLARILGLRMIQIAHPGARRVKCSMSVDEFRSHADRCRLKRAA